MKYVKWHTKQKIDLDELSAIGELSVNNLKEVIKTFLFSGFKVFSGFNIQQTSVPSGSVRLPISLGLQDGNIINVISEELIDILEDNGNWGTPQPADLTYPRYSIVCIKYTQKDSDSRSKWFIDDSDPNNPSEYQTTVNTRVEDYYDILVVHGTPASTPIVPTTPDGYVKIAEILISPGVSTITDGDITNKAPEATKTVEELLTALDSHNHDDLYYTKETADNRYPQKSFANVKVNGTTITSISKEDIIELVAGTNVTITPDNVNKKITIDSTGITDHGSLTGLSDDDHTQYLNVTRHAAIAGNPHSTKHSELQNILTVDPTSTDTTRNKHVSNKDIKDLVDHAANTENPHSVAHAQTSPSGVDPTSIDTTRNKHVSNKDIKDLVDHKNNTQIHVYIGNTQPSIPSQQPIWIDNSSTPWLFKVWNGLEYEVMNTMQ